MSEFFKAKEGEMDLRELIASFWAHKFLIALITILALSIAGYFYLTASQSFTAKAIFFLKKENNSQINLSGEGASLAAIAGLGGIYEDASNSLLEQISSREFILNVSKVNSLSKDPFFNKYNPDAVEPEWKTNVKKTLGLKTNKIDKNTVRENSIVNNFKKFVEVKKTDGGAIAITVTHSNSTSAANYANSFMNEIRKLVEIEVSEEQSKRLDYLSEILADALQDMDQAQKNLKDYALKNSTRAEENFISGSLKLDQLRTEQRRAYQIADVLGIVEDLITRKSLNDRSYQILRSTSPLVDDVDFRRILGMSETISAWTWPNIETINAVTATLNDRVKRLNADIQKIENSSKIYADSADTLAKFTRDAKIAEATYTVLIEQVKSQSLAAGFQATTFKVYEYATPPLSPSSPNRRIYLGLALALGLLFGFALTLINTLIRGVYYRSVTLISEAEPILAIKSGTFRKLSKHPTSKIVSQIKKSRVVEIDEAEIKLANRKVLYILNCGSKLTASDTARFLATQSSTSGRSVVLFDKTRKSDNHFEDKSIKNISGISVVNVENSFNSVIRQEGPSFFTSTNFTPTVETLSSNFDQVIIFSDKREALVGLMALKSFDPGIVVLSSVRKTKRMDIKKIRETQPIDVLFYD